MGHLIVTKWNPIFWHKHFILFIEIEKNNLCKIILTILHISKWLNYENVTIVEMVWIWNILVLHKYDKSCVVIDNTNSQFQSAVTNKQVAES